MPACISIDGAPATPVLEEPALGGELARDAALGSRQAAARRLADVLGALVLADVRERYGRGPLRVVKWLIEPFALVGVYLVLVALVLDRPDEAPGLSVACAVVPFQLLMTAVVNALNAVNVRRTIIQNMAFPRLLIPLVSALTASVVFIPSLVLVGIMMAAYGVAPTLALAWLPAVLVVTLTLAVGFSYAASLIGLWFFDLRSVAVACVRILFFVGAPAWWRSTRCTASARDLLPLNPLTGLFESYRDVFLYGQSPAAWELLYPLAAAALLLVALVPLYAVSSATSRRSSDERARVRPRGSEYSFLLDRARRVDHPGARAAPARRGTVLGPPRAWPRARTRRGRGPRRARAARARRPCCGRWPACSLRTRAASRCAAGSGRSCPPRPGSCGR